MINQRLYTLDKAHRVRQSGMKLKSGFVYPARMDVEKPGIVYRAKSVDAQAAGFLA